MAKLDGVITQNIDGLHIGKIMEYIRITNGGGSQC